MECNVCLNEWDEQRCVPRMLPCGHSYCGDCLTLLFKQSNQQVSCPKCMQDHKLMALNQLEQAFPKNWALIALADSHKPTAPLIQMRMGTPSKKTSLRSKLFQSLSASGKNMAVLYSARQRGSSDSSTFLSALSGSLRRSRDAAIADEEYKSDEEIMRRIAASDSESGQSDVDDDDGKVQLKSSRRERRAKRLHRNPEASDEEEIDSSASEISEKSNLNDEEEPFLEPEAMCRQHNMKIHSWHKKTRKQLCTHCIQSDNLASEPVVQIYPQAVREIKTRMHEAKELNKLRKMQLTQVMGHLTEAQTKNRQIVESKLRNHLSSMRKLFEDYDTASKMQLAQAFKRQDLKISAIEQRVGEDLDQLCNDDISLQSMFEHEDLLLIYMTQAVDNLYAKTVNYRPSIEDFNDLVINVDVKPDAAADFKQMLIESQSINFDALQDIDSARSSPVKPKAKSRLEQSPMHLKQKARGLFESPEILREVIVQEEKMIQKQPTALTVDKLFLKDEHWLCTACGQRQDGADIICIKCLKFKPIIFFPNLAHNPADVTTKELKAISRRRKLERKLVIAAEKAGQSLQGNSSTTWYIISNKWLYKWKCFIQNRITLNNFFDNEDWAASIALSNNSDVGVLPPGLISNEEDLFQELKEEQGVASQEIVVVTGKQLKRDLRLNINYRAVNPYVWYLYYINYGGGAGSVQVPQLPRESIDLYSRDMSKLIKIYWGEGKILPQIKLNSLQNLGKEVIIKFMRKRNNKRGSKDGSSSKKHQRMKLAQSSNLLCEDDGEGIELTKFSSNRSEVKNSTKSISFLSKLKLCAYAAPSSQVNSVASSQLLKQPSSQAGLGSARLPTSSFSQIEQLLSDDHELQFGSNSGGAAAPDK